MMCKQQHPTISIVSVCYNEPAENVRLSLDSICTQTYDNVEKIVIDGGSRPETLAAIDNYSSHIDKYVSEPDNGIYDAMNKGLAMATGDFVIFMNIGDRFFSCDTVQKMVEYSLDHPMVDCLYGDVVIIDENGNEWAGPQVHKLNRFSVLLYMICHQSIMARRSVFEAIGNFDLKYRLIADKDWVHKSILAGMRWAHTDMFVCYYDGTGVSSSIDKRDCEINRFVAQNFSVANICVGYLLRKYRNFKQRLIRSVLRRTYKGYPVFIAK